MILETALKLGDVIAFGAHSPSHYKKIAAFNSLQSCHFLWHVIVFPVISGSPYHLFALYTGR